MVALFTSALIKHLPHSYSDHCPLLLELEEEESGNVGLRPFKFEAVWTTSSDFNDMLRKEWKGESSLASALQGLSVKLRAWNKATFGNIFRRKRRNALRLGRIQKALASRTTSFLINLEHELRDERNLILLQEELLWRQKSRNEWLKSGDDSK